MQLLNQPHESGTHESGTHARPQCEYNFWVSGVTDLPTQKNKTLFGEALRSTHGDAEVSIWPTVLECGEDFALRRFREGGPLSSFAASSSACAAAPASAVGTAMSFDSSSLASSASNTRLVGLASVSAPRTFSHPGELEPAAPGGAASAGGSETLAGVCVVSAELSGGLSLSLRGVVWLAAAQAEK